MTTFESIMCLAATAAVIILAFGILVIVKKLNDIAELHITTWSHFNNVINQLCGIMSVVGQTNGRIDGFIHAFKKLLEHNKSIENFLASYSSLIIKLLKEIENDMNEHGIAQAKWFDSMSNKLTTIANHTNETTNEVAKLTDFEKRNEKRNDEMFARCEEINRLQLKELQQRTHTYSVFDQFPPVDVVGVTATGICQECNGRNVCKHYDVNRNRCFVADRKED